MIKKFILVFFGLLFWIVASYWIVSTIFSYASEHIFGVEYSTAGVFYISLAFNIFSFGIAYLWNEW